LVWLTNRPGVSQRDDVRFKPSNRHSIAAGIASLTGFVEATFAAVFGLTTSASASAGADANEGGSTPGMPVGAEGGTDTDACDSAALTDGADAANASAAAEDADTAEAAEGIGGAEGCDAPEAGVAQATVSGTTDDAGTMLSNVASTTTRVP
jgi:hypothetical protein